jgi:hypothetical protein
MVFPHKFSLQEKKHEKTSVFFFKIIIFLCLAEVVIIHKSI